MMAQDINSVFDHVKYIASAAAMFTALCVGGCGKAEQDDKTNYINSRTQHQEQETASEKRASRAQTLGLITDLRTATQLYKSDEGRLPVSGIENLVAALTKPGRRGLPYFEPTKGSFYDGRVFTDHLGQPLVYKTYLDEFSIYSLGPNGIDENGSGDDITKR